MEKTVGCILKGDDVKFEGCLRLDVAQVPPSLPKEKSAVSEPEACVVENYPEFAVIEVTCSCGAKMRLKCEYTRAETSAEGQNRSPDT